MVRMPVRSWERRDLRKGQRPHYHKPYIVQGLRYEKVHSKEKYTEDCLTLLSASKHKNIIKMLQDGILEIGFSYFVPPWEIIHFNLR